MIRAVVADDEATARAGICALLARYGDIRVIAQCRTADETRHALETMEPDLLFLDVELAGSSGLEVLQNSDELSGPLIVFVTAFDAHAITAFEHHAVDYLLKPYSDARFGLAVQRVRNALEDRMHRRFHREILGGARLGQPVATIETHEPPSPYLERIAVRSRNKVKLVPTDRIDWIEADGDYVRIHAEGRSLLHRATMTEIEQSLDPAKFVRVHRSTIVSITSVTELRQENNDTFVALLSDGAVRPISERGRARLSGYVGGAI
jgi:two-component system LytT family response regulator